MDCIFCKIVKGEIPKELRYESENLLAFDDISPSADIHILIVPKEHIGAVSDLSGESGALLAEIFKAANDLVLKNNLKDDLYRIVVNGGKAQHVPHLHFHLLGGQLKKMV